MKSKSENEQVKAFRKAARELGCDESEERFQEALRAVAKQKPKGKASEKRKPTGESR
jgi:hypothetical protein